MLKEKSGGTMMSTVTEGKAINYKTIKDREKPGRSFQYSQHISLSDKQNTSGHQVHNQHTARTCIRNPTKITSYTTPCLFGYNLN